MLATSWRAVTPSLAPRLRDARLQTHHAAQLATALGISYLARRADDSHTNLEWLPHVDALASNAVTGGGTAVRLALIVPTLSISVIMKERPQTVLTLHGRTMQDAAVWIRDQLKAAGLNEEKYTLARHYEIPAHDVANGRTFDATASVSFNELASWFHNGVIALNALKREQRGASEVRCWPHHFDVGLVIDRGNGTSVGAGMEPGDAYYDEPYFYVNMRPAPRTDQLRGALAGGGSWHTHEWLGAVLPGSRLDADTPRQESQAGDFLASAVRAASQLL